MTFDFAHMAPPGAAFHAAPPGSACMALPAARAAFGTCSHRLVMHWDRPAIPAQHEPSHPALRPTEPCAA